MSRRRSGDTIRVIERLCLQKEGALMKAVGIPVNRGMALAPARLIPPWPAFSEKRRESRIPKARQIASVQNAVSRLGAFYTERANGFFAIGDKDRGDIILTHNAILHDPPLQEEIVRQIQDDYALESAVLRAFRKYSVTLTEIGNEYFGQRAADLEDVATRLICTILGREFPEIRLDGPPVILVAADIPPSVMAGLHPRRVAGVVLTAGGQTSHSAIIAASLGVPVVTGCEGAQNQVTDGERVFLDGHAGELHWGLGADQLEAFTQMVQRNDRHMQLLDRLAGAPTQTADPAPVRLCANGQDVSSCGEINRFGCDGIGLFRTEFLFLGRQALPSEDEQFFLYKSIVTAMQGKTVVFRTLDMGGDKILPCIPSAEEANPFMGYRAIRMYLDREDVFTPQIRAILRASAFGKVRIMFPMISNLEEFLSAKGCILTLQQELTEQGIACDPNIPIGTMIEVPSAAVNADILALHADFLSIGTNDLTQYTLAVDRLNTAVSYLYNHFDPAVVRLIQYTLQAADRRQKECSICGEMAADPLAVPLLLGLGLRSFSVSPGALLRTRKLISLCRMDECRQLAKAALQSVSAKEVMEKIQHWMPASIAEWTV